MSDPKFLTLEEVIRIHDRQLAATGGLAGVRDRGLLASAVEMPKASWGGAFLHEDVFAMAAAYAFHIAENQPFIDGNKRTAIVAADVFLSLNGVDLPRATEPLYEAMIGIAAKRLDKEGLAVTLRALCAAFADRRKC